MKYTAQDVVEKLDTALVAVGELLDKQASHEELLRIKRALEETRQDFVTKTRASQTQENASTDAQENEYHKQIWQNVGRLTEALDDCQYAKPERVTISVENVRSAFAVFQRACIPLKQRSAAFTIDLTLADEKSTTSNISNQTHTTHRAQFSQTSPGGRATTMNNNSNDNANKPKQNPHWTPPKNSSE